MYPKHERKEHAMAQCVNTLARTRRVRARRFRSRLTMYANSSAMSPDSVGLAVTVLMDARFRGAPWRAITSGAANVFNARAAHMGAKGREEEQLEHAKAAAT